MKLAIAQMKTSAGDFAQTARRMVDHARRAAEQGVDLLVFPMAVLCGASPVQPVDREGFMLDLADCVMSLAERLACPCLVPILTEFGDVAVPDALLINNGDITPVGLSARLAGSAGESDEQSAPSLPEIEFAGARLGVAFTYEDLDTYDDYAYDVDVIVFLSDYGFAVDDPSSALGSSLTEGRFLADARTTGAWIVGVGSLGCYDLQVFGGSSFVLAPWGELAAQAPSLEEALVVCDVDPSAEGPLAEPLTPEVYDAPLMTWGVLAMGLAEVCERAGAPGACVLLDGTLPSALAAALAVDALGPERVWALVGAQDGEGESVARALVRALAIPADHARPAEVASEASGALASGLLQASLAALAQECGGIVVGAADKTGRALEAAPALSAAQINPFGDLYVLGLWTSSSRATLSGSCPFPTSWPSGDTRTWSAPSSRASIAVETCPLPWARPRCCCPRGRWARLARPLGLHGSTAFVRRGQGSRADSPRLLARRPSMPPTLCLSSERTTSARSRTFLGISGTSPLAGASRRSSHLRVPWTRRGHRRTVPRPHSGRDPSLRTDLHPRALVLL